MAALNTPRHGTGQRHRHLGASRVERWCPSRPVLPQTTHGPPFPTTGSPAWRQRVRSLQSMALMETHRANASGRRRTALIVDECAPMRAAIRDLLAPELECEEVEKLEEAIAAAGLRRPRVLICDAPVGGTGPELCRRVRADQCLREVPLILLSADADPDRRAAALEQGADDYLSKPFAPRELLARVRSLVRLDDARQEALRQNRELERAHCELLEAQRQLLESERLATVGGLATELAHAINNPFAVVWAGFEELS